MSLRKIFYKVKLHLSDGRFMPIMIATTDINRIPEIVEKNKGLYMRSEFYVTGFSIDDVKYTVQMDEKQYEDELMHCDIVDEQDIVMKGEIVKVLGTQLAPKFDNF